MMKYCQNYQPKGSQCANCKKKLEDCSKLEFHKMRLYSTDGKVAVVLCSEFSSDKK